MKKLVGSVIIMLLSLSAFTQLKVHSTGRVSIGNTSAPSYTCEISGYSALRLFDGSAYIRFTPHNNYGIIGTHSGDIILWTNSTIGYNDLFIEDLTEYSDSNAKFNIKPLYSGTEVIMNLQPKYYNRKIDSIQIETKYSYGFLAQDVQQVNPDLVEYGVDSSLGVNTTQIIPFLVLAFQEQQVVIDSLSQRITELENSVYEGGVSTKSLDLVTNENGELIELGQNNPNPFKESTFIPYNIPLSTTSAQIIIYDMRGQELKSYQITEFGESQLLIEGNSFKAGMYMYALIVDGKYVDSKRMILSK